MNHDTIPSEVRSHDNQHSKVRQNLRDVVHTRLCADRPVQPAQFTRASNAGSEAFEIRKPDLNETALSFDEVEHAIQYGLTT
jgi:hypothetical protein